ncbi:MAG: dihydrodipicolinate synthase family protein [Bacteroidota bacterium]
MPDRPIAPLHGVLAPPLTPFEADGRVAEALLIAHARHLLDAGCAGLVPFGTTSEAASLGLDERVHLLDRLVEAGVPPERMIVGVGTTNVPDTVRLAAQATRHGCAGVLLLPPFYYPGVSDDGLFAYAERLIEQVNAHVGTPGVRIYLYHIPQIAGVGWSANLVRRLRAASPDHIVGIKDSTGDWANTQALLGIDGLTVYPGTELLLPEALAHGAPGCISATANLNAPAIAEAIRLHDDDRAAFDAHFATVARFRRTVQPYGAIPAQKALLARRAGDARWRHVRPPLRPLSDDAAEALANELVAVS